MKRWWMLVAAATLVTTLGSVRPARAEPVEDAGWGVLTVLADLVYMPVKTTYAVLGGITGGLAYACTAGDFDTANNVWQTSLGGTYVLTPSMIRGEEPITFAGSTTSSAAPSAVADAPATDPVPQHGRRDETLPDS
jgi:hypothetical protein